MSLNNQKIPEGWSVKKLRECLEIKHGKPQHDIEDPHGLYPILASGGQIGRTNSFLCSEPSVLIGRKGTIDKPQYMETPFWTVDTLFYSHIKSGYMAKYLFYKFQTINWNKYNEGSTIPSLSSSTIHSIKVLLPPLPEQEKIAGILGTWDEAIEKLSGLIEQKKLLKKGLMQKLLTGKTRLPTFTQPWKDVKLGEIADFYNGYAFKSESYINNGTYKIITIANVQQGKLIYNQTNTIMELPKDIQPNQILSVGDIIFSMTGNVGRVCTVSTNNCLLNQRVGKIIEKGVSKSFLYHLLLTDHFINKMVAFAQGGAQDNLSLKDVKKYKILIPDDITEQQAIADVLSTADDEINLLNQKLEALKEQKKGLMQQLLTGQIRVKVN